MWALFDRPSEGTEHVYRRGTVYLSLALESTKWDMEVIIRVLEDLIVLKRERSDIDNTVEILELSKHEVVKEQLKEVAMSCGRKLRNSDSQDKERELNIPKVSDELI